ncbi:hypothetical protein PTMSG1_02622 [Pyrenophora teres f. maculata]|nr:hypothetical protein PTMSG1_02622 [Pyrenophora teres f. maculata]
MCRQWPAAVVRRCCRHRCCCCCCCCCCYCLSPRSYLHLRACLPACRLAPSTYARSLARSLLPSDRARLPCPALPSFPPPPCPAGSAKSSRQSRPRGTSLALVRLAIAMHDATCCFCHAHFAPAASRGSLGAPPAALSDASLAVARPAFLPQLCRQLCPALESNSPPLVDRFSSCTTQPSVPAPAPTIGHGRR